MVMRGSQIIDVSMIPGDKTTGSITPVVGIDGGLQLDYDYATQTMYWVDGKDDDRDDEREIIRTESRVSLLIVEVLDASLRGKC